MAKPLQLTPPQVADMPPVRDMDGHIVWRVRVVKGEKTCTACGNTTTGSYCETCVLDGPTGASSASRRKAGKLVPTTSYLQPGEYEVK